MAACERIGFECVEEAHREGIAALELRYSPRFASATSKLPWEDVLRAFQRGLGKATKQYGTEVGLICIVSRCDDLNAGYEAIDFAITHPTDFIGVDLAGAEIGYPCRRYKKIFQRALDARLSVTIHAGEGCGPENIWEAIDHLGATRIGHGVRAIQDKALMARLARDQILLETCPTSNYITRSIEKLEDHPLPRFLDAGIPCSISADDPGLFGVTLQDEFDRCKKYCGLSDADLQQTNQFAKEHSFLSLRSLP